MTSIVLKKYATPEPTIFSKVEIGGFFTERNVTLLDVLSRKDLLFYSKVLSTDGKSEWMVAIDGSIVKKPDGHTVVIPWNIKMAIPSKHREVVSLAKLSVGDVFAYLPEVVRADGSKLTKGKFVIVDPVNKGNNKLLVVSIGSQQCFEISTEHDVRVYDYLIEV